VEKRELVHLVQSLVFDCLVPVLRDKPLPSSDRPLILWASSSSGSTPPEQPWWTGGPAEAGPDIP